MLLCLLIRFVDSSNIKLNTFYESTLITRNFAIKYEQKCKPRYLSSIDVNESLSGQLLLTLCSEKYEYI